MKAQQTFNDGIVKIYKVGNIANPGDMPKDGLILKKTLRYDERTVGINRFYAAMQNNARVDYLIRCPRVNTIKVNDIAVLIDDNQYEIIQVQYPEEVDPKVMDLTLEKIDYKYLSGYTQEELEAFSQTELQRFIY